MNSERSLEIVAHIKLYKWIHVRVCGQSVKGVISTVPGSVWFGSVRNRSDFDASGSVNRKRVYGSVRDQSEPSS